MDGLGRRRPVLLSSAVKTQTLENYTLLDAPAEAGGAPTTSDITSSSLGTREWCRWRQQSRRKPILYRSPTLSSRPSCRVTAATAGIRLSRLRHENEPCLPSPLHRGPPVVGGKVGSALAACVFVLVCVPPAAALPGMVSRSLVSAVFGFPLCILVCCLSPRQQHYPAWYLARRPRLSLKFPYHNPYERIIVVVGSVLVFASLLACVWRGWFSRVSCCRPLCVRAIQVQARRSYDMMNLVLEV